MLGGFPEDYVIIQCCVSLNGIAIVCRPVRRTHLQSPPQPWQRYRSLKSPRLAWLAASMTAETISSVRYISGLNYSAA